MSLTDDFLRGLQKKNATTYSGGSNKLTKDFVNGVQKKKKKDEDDIAPVIITDDGIAPTFDSPAAEVGAFLGQSIGQSLQKKADEESFFDGWFKKGNKDVSKAILGTLSDFGEDLTTSIVGLGEKIVDAGAWLAPVVSKSQYIANGGGLGFNQEADRLFEEQNQAAKEEMSKFIAKDLYDEGKVAKQILSNLYASQEMTNIAQNGGMFTQEDLDRFNKNRGSAYNYMVTDMEKDSVLDEKSDSLVQSAGQLGATAALSAVGVPWYLITGASTFGSEAENALNQGATFEEAGLSATISAGAEILTEKISGGIKFGGKTLDEGLTKLLSRNISNRAVRTAAKLGIDMAGEGGEEILSGLMSAIGQKLTYAEEKELEELFSKEDAWESFIGGAVLGGVGSATQAAKGSITGVDSVTELTKNEQKVVDKLYEDALAEEAKKGKVTQKQKAEIYDDILNKLEKGYINTDIIEEVLGGDKYNTYKETLDSENALTEQEKKLNDEFSTLNKMVWQEMTGEQHDRREELRGQLEELRAKINDPQSKANKDMLKAQLTKDVYEMSKGDRLVESFFEQVRSKQKYQADLSQYTGRARDVIKKVMDSGLADNSNQTHEFWDWAAKMASDLDTDITLATNEQLLEMVKAEYAAEGKEFDESQFEGQTIDGYASKNGIVLNAASKRALNFIVGHEVTHKLEKTKHYGKLQKLLLEYAKDEYESRFQKRSGQYSNKFKADDTYKSKVDMEVTGDLVGDYLFTDKGFIDHLTKDQNVFQQVWNEIKYMAKIATAGSEQAKQLERVKREFERAYREANKKAQSGVQFSVGYHAGDLGKAESLRQQGLNRGTGHFGTGTYFVGNKAAIEGYNSRKGQPAPVETVDFDKYHLFKPKSAGDGYALHDFLRGVDGYWDRDADAVNTMDEYESLQGKLNELVYDIESEEFGETDPGKESWMAVEKEFLNDARRMMGSYRVGNTLTETLNQLTNGNFQFDPRSGEYYSYDFDTNQFTEYTEDEIIQKLNAEEGGWRAYEGIEKLADDYYSYSRTSRYESWSDSIKDVAKVLGISEHEVRNVFQSVTEDINSKGYTDADMETADSAATRFMKALGYEGIDVRGIKELDNTTYGSVIYDLKGEDLARKKEIGTAKYSVSDSDGKQLTKEQQDYFKDSKMRDESGNLKVMYHGTPNGDFTVFKDGTYFTDNKEYADKYQNPGASSISTGKIASNPKTYEVYLDIKKPFDITDAEARRIYIEDYIKGGNAMGINPYLSDAEYDKIKTIDWTEGEDLREFLIDNGYDYDGLVLDEGGTGGYGDEVKSRGKSYVVFSPEQVKNIDNLKPTADHDIRYSVSETDKTYADAVKNRDWDTAQKLVDKAAKKAGYKKAVYHGTESRFTVFDTDEESTTRPGHVWDAEYPDGTIFLAEDYNVASYYGDRVMEMYLDTSGMKVFREPDMYAHRAMDDKYGYEVYNYPVIAVKGKDMTIYATLDNTLVKSADTATYDDNGELIPLSERFKHSNADIRFSLSETVEETKDLIAAHNLTSEQVLKSIELGGLPMPSIAVLKADSVHDEYGEVTLILPKEAIDPKANSANKVYGGDAWTPVYPRIEYKPSAKVEKKISDKYYSLARKIGYDAVRPMYAYVTDLERQLNNSGGESSLLEKLYDDTEMMNVYLQDSGKGKIEPIERETVTEISPEQAEMNQFFIDALGDEVIAEYPTPKGESIGLHKRQFVEQYGEEIRTAYKRFFMELYDFSETEADNAVDNTSKADLLHIVRDAYQYTQNKGVTVKTDIDRQATNDAIRSAAADGYKAWVDGLFKGVEEKTGIRNNQDYYTRSGNPRSWDALHWENTLENVVKTMRGQEQTGTGSLSPYNTLASLAHKRYGSIAEIKADSDRLGKIPKEEYEAMGDAFADRFAAIASSIKDPAERNHFIATDDAAELIVDAVKTQKTKAGMLSYMQKWNKRVTAQTVDDIISLVSDIANMPTGYFEAKPQRAVGFEEVGVFVIPYDADVKLKQELLNRGYSIAEYDPDVEGDRRKVVNQFEEYKFSLSDVGEQHKQYGRYNVYAKDMLLNKDDISPVAQNATGETISKTESVPVVGAENETTTEELFPDNLAPVQSELEQLMAEEADMRSVLEGYAGVGDIDAVNRLLPEYEEIRDRIRELEADENQRADSLTDEDAPPVKEAPYYGNSKRVMPRNPFADREWDDVVGTKNRSVKAYMYEHPEVKPFFQEEAMKLLGELNDTTRGERFFNDQVYYESGGEKGITGVKRHTSESMATLLDDWGMSYAEIEKGLKAIIEDNGAENITAAKKIEFMLNNRLLNGYKNFYGKGYIEANQDYIDTLEEMEINSYSKEAFDSFMATADQYAPEDVAPVKPLAKATPDTDPAPIFDSKDKDAVKGQTTMFEPPKPNPKVASVLTEESAIQKEKSGIGGKLVSALVDKGMVFENLSLETGNHEVQAKWNYALPSNTEARAQYFMEHGAEGVKPLKDIKNTVDKSGKTEQFYDYLYHVHNIDRMTLEDRFDDTPNKTVFGETITADVSRKKVAQYEKANPEFKNWANDVYAFNKHLRNLLVENDIISQETADLWEKMYPHYVPIRRVDTQGQNISVPLDSRKTGVNNPVKRAIGGSSDIMPLFETMAQRAEQTYRAIARNSFGIELKNTLGTTIEAQKDTTGVDEMIDTIEAQEDHLLKPGSWNSKPTFTVFENGERVEFEITEDMYDALKPADGLLGHRSKAIGKVGDMRRNLLTVWNPVFALYRNPIKDIQDVAVNSQHAVKTYLNVPNAILQMATGGKYATEYHQNGGKSNTYFDSRTNKFKAEDNIFKKVFGMPVRAIETAGEFIEEIPRLAEYIASRKNGRSVERSMLDAARVTTNFAAGGDFTKFLNSHGFTFLNAGVQGASQHVRNIREAKQEGLKGYVKVLAKYAIAGLPTVFLNGLLWDDDEEYEELSDYVKQNYYVVAKTQDGKFVRIPKGRTAAVMGELMQQMDNLRTGNDEVDFGTFYELFMNNIAPNNPIENNILAPIMQVANNEAWYGGDLVPSRLQDLPAEEQFDESTDSISKWLGEKTGFSPYKINYLLDQYSGGLGDVFLPMLTPEAESGDDSLMGNMLAPWKKELTTDMVLNNKNPGDFYDLRDELEVNANAKDATEEDKMKSLYMDSVSWEMGDLYAQKREIQSGDLPDDEKYEQVREIQEQINELAKTAMQGYNDVTIEGMYSEVGNKRYNMDAESGKWYEIKPKNADGTANYYYQKEQTVTKALGISYAEYWNNREEYNYAYDKPEQYALAQAVGGYQSYRGFTSELWNIKADKDKNGKSISGSRKAKVINYLNNLDADYYTKIILFKNEYNADNTYNMEIINYLNGRDDISYKQMESILKYLGFEVDAKGNISW